MDPAPATTAQAIIKFESLESHEIEQIDDFGAFGFRDRYGLRGLILNL